VVIPSVFIVGAPRCGTTSLANYLRAHPRLFLSEPKEPHHFGSDLDIRLRPYADRQRYLELFEGAGPDRQAGEASVLYLYSQTAPREIQELSPSARVIILLRDPVEMVPSLHTHNLFVGHEDLIDLEEALAAEPERREGRRLSSSCLVPAALQYSRLGRYAEHVRRYLDVFGSERVKCILFEDLKTDPERIYRETLAFLGLEAAEMPDFKAHNERHRWRSPRLGRAMVTTFSSIQRPCVRLPWKRVRKPLLATLGIVFYGAARLNMTKAGSSPISDDLQERLRQMFRDDVAELAGVVGRDLSSWLPSSRTAAGAA
jgi:hypothetical protein